MKLPQMPPACELTKTPSICPWVASSGSYLTITGSNSRIRESDPGIGAVNSQTRGRTRVIRWGGLERMIPPALPALAALLPRGEGGGTSFGSGGGASSAGDTGIEGQPTPRRRGEGRADGAVGRLCAGGAGEAAMKGSARVWYFLQAWARLRREAWSPAGRPDWLAACAASACMLGGRAGRLWEQRPGCFIGRAPASRATHIHGVRGQHAPVVQRFHRRLHGRVALLSLLLQCKHC